MYRSSNGSQILRLAEDIVPIAEFKAHLSEVVRDLRGRGRPMVITQNGKPAAVLLSPEDFDQLTYQSLVVASIDDGLQDLHAGRVNSHDEVGRILDKRFGRQAKVKNPSAKRTLKSEARTSKTSAGQLGSNKGSAKRAGARVRPKKAL